MEFLIGRSLTNNISNLLLGHTLDNDRCVGLERNKWPTRPRTALLTRIAAALSDGYSSRRSWLARHPLTGAVGSKCGERQLLALTGCALLSANIPLSEVDRQCCDGAGRYQFDPRPILRGRARTESNVPDPRSKGELLAPEEPFTSPTPHVAPRHLASSNLAPRRAAFSIRAGAVN
jgi:hypothetical protein